MTSARREKLKILAGLMKKQNGSSLPIIGPLLDCIDLVVTPDETQFLIRLGKEGPVTYEEALALADKPAEEFRGFFDTLLNKGLIWPRHFDPDENRFVLAPMVVGWFELQLCGGRETAREKAFARCLERLVESWKRYNVFPLRNLQNYYFLKKGTPSQSIPTVAPRTRSETARKIEVKKKITLPPDRIYTGDSIRNLIEKHGSKGDIALMHCFCRQWRKMVDDVCQFELPAESCITIGPVTHFIVRYGFGRFVSKQEAIAVIDETRKAGAVQIVFHEKDDIHMPEIGICNCCPDCCGLLGSYNRGAIPLLFKSGYMAQVTNREGCVGCGQCEAFCPVHAVSLRDDRAIFNGAKCIGCGQCADRCPEEIIRMQPDERVVKLPLLKKSEQRFQQKTCN